MAGTSASGWPRENSNGNAEDELRMSSAEGRSARRKARSISPREELIAGAMMPIRAWG